MPTFQSIFFVLSIVLLPLTCQSPKIQAEEGASTSTESIRNKQRLFQNLREQGEIVIVYGTADERAIEAYQKFAEAVKANSRRIRFLIKKDTEFMADELAKKIVFLIGTPASNLHLQHLIADLPIEVAQKKLTFGGKVYQQPSTVVNLSFYPNPLNKQLPLSLVTGLDDEAIADFLIKKSTRERFLGWSRWDYEVYEQLDRVVMGNLADVSWEMDKRVHYDFSNLGDTLSSSLHFTFISKNATLSLEEAQQLVQNCETIAQKILDFTGKSDFPKINCHIYGSAEEKGLMLSNTHQAHIDWKKATAHIVVNDIYKNNHIGKEHELILRALLGQPKIKALEVGLAIYFTESWQKKGYAYWASKLYQSGNMAALKDMVNNKMFDKSSNIVMGCLSASFVAFLVEEWGQNTFLKKYLNWQPTENEIVTLEKRWLRYLNAISQKLDFSNQKRTDLTYLKGFNFAHEGYSIYNGYISQKATEALHKLKAKGSNAVAIVPYSYMRDPNQPSWLLIDHSAGSENDESIIHTAFQAQKLGMSVVLKPQIWLGRGHWPGSVEMKNEADWQQFFDDYYRWIRHYSLLAEIHEMESLCLGVEFVKTTLTRPKDWQNIIKKIRQLYAGHLTYAANWGEEFEQITFWDELDYIGLNCYYPLNDKDEASKKDLKMGFQKAIDKIKLVCKKYQKPLVFTEIGFRSINAPWKNPHDQGDNTVFNSEHQKRCYEVVFETIRDKSWCKGILWWKYPSYLEYQGVENNSFTPNNKAADEVVEEWFGKMDD